MTIHQLLAPLTEPQQAVVDIIWAAWRQLPSRFPVYAHVEREMDRRGFALEAVLPTFPGIGESQFGPRYRAVWWDALSHGAPNRPVGLSVVGLEHVAGSEADSVVRLFLEVLSGMADRRLGAVSDPFTAEDPTVARQDLLQAVSRGRDPNFIPDLFRSAQSLAEYEPATSGTGLATANEADSPIRCTRNVRHFHDVKEVSDYLARLDAYLGGPPSTTNVVVEEPPLALAAELDFLDVVWRLRFGADRPLLALRGASAVARLGTDVASAEEFAARLSDLAQVTKSFDLKGIPGHKDRQHPIQRLSDFIRDELHLEVGAIERIDSSGAVLEAAIDIRNGGVHHNVATKAVLGLELLGVPYPITDWRSAWRTIRNAVTRAIAALREELQADA